MRLKRHMNGLGYRPCRQCRTVYLTIEPRQTFVCHACKVGAERANAPRPAQQGDAVDTTTPHEPDEGSTNWRTLQCHRCHATLDVTMAERFQPPGYVLHTYCRTCLGWAEAEYWLTQPEEVDDADQQ